MKSDAQREQERQEFLELKQHAEYISKQFRRIDEEC